MAMEQKMPDRFILNMSGRSLRSANRPAGFVRPAEVRAAQDSTAALDVFRS